MCYPLKIKTIIIIIIIIIIIGFLSNTGRGPPENHKDTKPAFNVVRSSFTLLSQRNAI